jgi:hypothetical protein
MNLTELFYGKFVPPTVAKVRKHKVGLLDGNRYKPPKKVQKIMQAKSPEDLLTPAAKKMLKILRQQKDYISCLDMELKCGYTRNHCNIILCSLYKAGFASRIKKTKPGTRYYIYKAKEQEND